MGWGNPGVETAPGLTPHTHTPRSRTDLSDLWRKRGEGGGRGEDGCTFEAVSSQELRVQYREQLLPPALERRGRGAGQAQGGSASWQRWPRVQPGPLAFCAVSWDTSPLWASFAWLSYGDGGACLVLQLKQLYQMLFRKNPAPSWHIQGAQPILSATFMVTRATRQSCSSGCFLRA